MKRGGNCKTLQWKKNWKTKEIIQERGKLEMGQPQNMKTVKKNWKNCENGDIQKPQT